VARLGRGQEHLGVLARQCEHGGAALEGPAQQDGQRRGDLPPQPLPGEHHHVEQPVVNQGMGGELEVAGIVARVAGHDHQGAAAHRLVVDLHGHGRPPVAGRKPRRREGVGQAAHGVLERQVDRAGHGGVEAQPCHQQEVAVAGAAGGRLAIGPGHADHMQVVGGVAVESGRGIGDGRARVGHDQVRDGRLPVLGRPLLT